MKNTRSFGMIAVLASWATLASVRVASGQGGVTSGGSQDPTSVNNMTVRETVYVCGGKAQQGTPIAASTGTGNVNRTTGSLTISGIPDRIPAIVGPRTTIVRADLFWTVLTDTPLADTGVINFNGTPVNGTSIGKAPTSPCFVQTSTNAWRADVTSLITAPGNGTYTITGAPGGSLRTSDFTEGATLQILWANANASLFEDNLYHAAANGLLAVTQGDLFSQTMTMTTQAVSPPSVTALLYEVIGNGQTNGFENLRYITACTGGTGLNFDNTLNGSTSTKAANTCSSTASVPGSTECWWDDDVLNVGSAFACPAGHGSTSATLVSNTAGDCLDWPALNMLNSTDNAPVIAACGVAVDATCPPGGTYRNHGEYVSCVAHAANDFLSGLPEGGSCPREEIQSACVNPRARSNVGKP